MAVIIRRHMDHLRPGNHIDESEADPDSLVIVPPPNLGDGLVSAPLGTSQVTLASYPNQDPL